MTEKELEKQYIERYNAEIKSGSTIKINYSLPYVAIDFSNGEEYFFQGQNAEDLLKNVPDYIDDEVYLLVNAQC